MHKQGIKPGKGHRWLAAVGVALGAFAAAHAATPPAATSHGDAWQRSALRTLAAMPDADAKIAAAALVQQFPDEKTRTMPLMDRAVTLAPTAADIALLDINLCSATPGCPAAEREAKLRSVAPDNGAFWMMALHQATVRGDKAGTASVIRRLALAHHFDLHHASLGKRLSD
jgi:hypothetical protein